jgi:hypothetical protein
MFRVSARHACLPPLPSIHAPLVPWEDLVAGPQGRQLFRRPLAPGHSYDALRCRVYTTVVNEGLESADADGDLKKQQVPNSDTISSPSPDSEPGTHRREWRGSPERAALRARYIRTALPASLLTYIGIIFIVLNSYGRTTSQAIGLSQRAVYWIAGAITFIGFIVVLVAATSMSTARDRFYVAQEQSALKAVDQALDDITGPDDLMGLMRANRKQMDAYDALARSQARTSYRASQIAMGIGLIILAAGIAIAVFAHSDATKYAAAIVTACGAAVGGYVSHTFISVHLHASEQMNFYFRQPLVQSYLLSAERLAQRLPDQAKPEQISKILASAMAQIDPSRVSDSPAPRRPRRPTLKAAPTSSNAEAVDSAESGR